MKLGQATIKDIAKELNVSLSTVSRALKNYPGISEDTKRKVKETAERLNYRPNAVALSLRQSRSFTIGVIIPEVVHFFFSTVISGIEEIAYANGYNVILCQTNEKYEREKSVLDTMLANQVDGLLVSFSKETKDFEHFTKLIALELPIVFFDRIPEIDDAVNVTVNDFQGAYNAVTHLLQEGYRKIAHISGPENLTITKQRKAGYLSALKDFDPSIAYSLIVECPSGNEEESFQLVKEIFQQPGEKPDALFAHHDMAAAGAMMALKSLGIRIPDEVGLVGYSNWQFSSMIDPPLSTVSQPGACIGETATKILLGMMNKTGNLEKEQRSVVLDTDLIIRKSSKR
ncbi:LacI family DNA-binding transcriptional regulator [Mongoliitalea daihaiensis]|uniref:LacI family DNA-binding transcriptional regulator n=1 Tax=Mongoliitalea daihaiensis TaxID=2782006 RepID=UPI001F38914A|nr:LacI family DNA-binding transcriptional regulator [Mongoliitalea daihaiensis]UJP64544.1 LacI family DNA-binding transcriptional regulator [Mongoliitalea daihaiensis]